MTGTLLTLLLPNFALCVFHLFCKQLFKCPFGFWAFICRQFILLYGMLLPSFSTLKLMIVLDEFVGL